MVERSLSAWNFYLLLIENAGVLCKIPQVNFL